MTRRQPNPDPRLILSLCAVAFLSLYGATQAGAQTPSDSIAAWTEAMESGSLQDRMYAAARLSATGPDSLPEASVDAMIRELNRLQDAMLYDTPIPGIDELEGESYGEYYMDLSVFAYGVGGDAARRSIILSSPVSLGLARRAATFGDEAIPDLVEMLEVDYEAGAALWVMGLAWFWADSTGAALSSASRRVIIEQFTDAGIRDERNLLFELSDALDFAVDPGFLPLVRWIRDTVEARDPEVFGLPRLTRSTIPELESLAESMSTSELFQRHRRMLDFLCASTTSGPRRGFCQATANQLATVERHVEAGRAGPAGNVLDAVIDRVDRALESGVLADHEHALLAGGFEEVLARLR